MELDAHGLEPPGAAGEPGRAAARRTGRAGGGAAGGRGYRRSGGGRARGERRAGRGGTGRWRRAAAATAVVRVRAAAHCRAGKRPSGRSWRCASPRPQRASRHWRRSTCEEHFASELLRRAATHLREGSLQRADGRRAGRRRSTPTPSWRACSRSWSWRRVATQSHPAMLEVQRLQLELARLERRIQQARGQEDVDVSALATRRGELKREFDGAYGGCWRRRGRGRGAAEAEHGDDSLAETQVAGVQ